ncbi:hypothetical protein E3W21_04375 [Pseudomonas sp. F01002]|nr:hypothetical protein E3W21_04375 [Pseudomonas sp. F01002]
MSAAVYTHPLWERACSRRGQYIQHSCRLTLRFREQARSHTGSVVFTDQCSGLQAVWLSSCCPCGVRLEPSCARKTSPPFSATGVSWKQVALPQLFCSTAALAWAMGQRRTQFSELQPSANLR